MLLCNKTISYGFCALYHKQCMDSNLCQYQYKNINYLFESYRCTVKKLHLPKRVATQAKIANRAAVLSPGEGREECWGKQTVSLSHSASLSFSFSPARAPPLRQGHTDTVTVPVLVKPETPSLKTKGT